MNFLLGLTILKINDAFRHGKQPQEATDRLEKPRSGFAPN
jgi:hypothetical protein